jgi:hypothetical protein
LIKTLSYSISLQKSIKHSIDQTATIQSPQQTIEDDLADLLIELSSSSSLTPTAQTQSSPTLLSTSTQLTQSTPSSPQLNLTLMPTKSMPMSAFAIVQKRPKPFHVYPTDAPVHLITANQLNYFVSFFSLISFKLSVK